MAVAAAGTVVEVTAVAASSSLFLMDRAFFMKLLGLDLRREAQTNHCTIRTPMGTRNWGNKFEATAK